MTTSTSHKLTQLTEQLFVIHGSANVGVIRHGKRALLIDCGDGEIRSNLAALGISIIDRILFTHHHRDSASGVTALASPATRITVPLGERSWFDGVDTFWNDPQQRWHLYNYHPHNLMLAQPVQVHDTVAGRDRLEYAGITIEVFDTPGHTDGSVSYAIYSEGNCFVFSGDLIYDAGQIWELYSLQKGEMGRSDYHGFLGDRERLLASLAHLLALSPAALIPTHGRIMHAPATAVAQLRTRLEQCYDRYVAISALRHYFPELFTAYEGRPNHMPIGSSKAVPAFLRHIDTTWVIISANGEAFVMDCGTGNVIEQLQAMQNRGEITEVTACWVTHYHDDHVDMLPQFQLTFPCTTLTVPVVADVVQQPLAYRLPCISPSIVRIDRRLRDGESWTWNEYRMTAYTFPGQTFYHGGLLVEGHGMRLFFSGDSFTPSGIDDYCAGNRNLLGNGAGYDHCLTILAQLQPTHIFNCHVAEAFEFTAAQIEWMRANLAKREQLYGELFPWDHLNYGMDEHWVRCFPYEQEVTAGAPVTVRVEFANHSTTPKSATCCPVLPPDLPTSIAPKTVTVPPKSDGYASFTFLLPRDMVTAPIRRIVPIHVIYDGHSLGQFREFILVIHP